MKNVAIILQSPVGRSDPQAMYLANSLSGIGLKVFLIQCVHADSIKRPYDLLNKEVEAFEFYPRIAMWTSGAITEFSFFARNMLLDLNVDTVFCFDYPGILTCSLLLEQRQTKLNVCIFMLENIEYMINSHGKDSLVVLQRVWDYSIIVYPEPNRLIIDFALYKNFLNLHKKIYIFPATCPSKNFAENVHCEEKNGQLVSPIKIIYAGSVVNESYVLEFARYIREQAFSNMIEFDIYGPLGPGCKEELDSILGQSSSGNRVRYFGIVNQGRLSDILPKYHFSLVAWRPVSANFYFASPNKFFQAIQHCVIPITTMHPLVASVVKKYDLSVVELDWNSSQWINAINDVFQRQGELKNMARSNYEKFSTSFSWEKEFDKFYLYILGVWN